MSSEMEKLFKSFEEQEKKLSPGRREELDLEGETNVQFMDKHTNEEVDRFLESLSRQEQVEFFTAAFWDYYKFFKNQKGEIA